MKIHKLMSIFLFSLTLVSIPIPVLADSQFEQVTESYKGKEIIVNVPKENEPLDYKSAFPGELLLGITKVHFYILIDDLRIDGKVSPLPSEKNVGHLDDGLLIRFPDLDRQKVLVFKTALAGESHFQGFTWSCVNTACKNLRSRVGVSLDGNQDGVFPSSTFNEILLNGFKDESGYPVRFEIYKTSRYGPFLEEIAREQRNFESGYAVVSGIMTSIVGVGIGTMGVIAYGVVSQEIKKNYNKCKLSLLKIPLALPLSVPFPANPSSQKYRSPESFIQSTPNESE